MKSLRLLIVAFAVTALGCGRPVPAKKSISMEDTAAALGHTSFDTTGLGAARARVTSQQQLDSQSAAIRASQRGATLPPPKRIERKAP